MPQAESVPSDYKLRSTTRDQILELQSNHNGEIYDFTFGYLGNNIFRTTFTSSSHPLPPYPSTGVPSANGNEGGVHFDLSESSKTITLDNIVAKVTWEHAPVVSLKYGDSGTLHSDLPFRGYAVDGAGIARYTTYDSQALHVGLGEKAAPMDLSGRAFRLAVTDAFGYDVYRTDPLYKHIPLLITARKEGCVAQFSTTHSRGFWSVGAEIDGLWGRYKVYRQDYGGLEEYLIVGKTLKHVLYSYATLIGMPLLVPRWAFGYIAGGYKYTSLDDPPAHKAAMEFAEKLKEHDIPCSAFQMSSGYHVAEEEPKVRNVFHWNRHRFPNPEAFIRNFHDNGIRLLANVKPFLLRSHPDFSKLLENKAFFTNPKTGGPGFMRLWSNGGGESGEGCHLDFTSQAARDFWYNGIQGLKKQGIDAAWNDNQEYSLPDDSWTIRRDSIDMSQSKIRSVPDHTIGSWGRAMHTELMGKVSHDALQDLEPKRRPFVLTRSATAGTMSYCCSTWSGDNISSWDSMKGANALSLSQGLSLLHCAGHDVGGFEGPQPTPELFVRWVQLAAHSPRFAINSFKTSPDNNRVGEVIEPWMYPEVTPLIRKAIKRRYELIPLLYSLSLESHLYAVPPQRWVGWGYENDPEVWTPALKTGDTQYWLGDTLMVGGVYEPGRNTASIYLPMAADGLCEGYWNINSKVGEYYLSGKWIEIDSPWDTSIPILARFGGALPIGKGVQTTSSGETTDPSWIPKDDWRGVEIFPPPPDFVHQTPRTYKTIWFEDDGISAEPEIAIFSFEYESNSTSISVMFGRDDTGSFKPSWDQLHVIMPIWDDREIVGAPGYHVSNSKFLTDGRRSYTLVQLFEP